MSFLIAGLVIFIAIHLIPSAPRLRAALVERLGEKPYRGVFSAVTLLSLGWPLAMASRVALSQA